MRRFLLLVLVFGLTPTSSRAEGNRYDGASCSISPEPHLEALSDVAKEALAIAAMEEDCAGQKGLAPSSRQLHVPPSIQTRSTCGIHALRMGALYWTRENEIRSREILVDGSGEAAEVAMTLGLAERANDGAMSIENLGRLAKHYGYTTTYRSSGTTTLGDLKAEIERGNPVIVPFYLNPDESGMPSTKAYYDGEKRVAWDHAAVIEGFCVDRWGRQYVIVKHAWRNTSYAFPVSTFLKSWKLSGAEALVMKGTL